MLRKIAICILSVVTLGLSAQTAELKFGHVNSQELMMDMPQMKDAQAKLEAMAKQYEDELAKMNQEYEKKVNDFQALKDADDGIKKSRLAEIQSLEQRVGLVKQTAQEQIQKKQEELVAPVIEIVKKAIKEVGDEQGFMYIFDLSVPATVYQSPKSVDIAPLLRKKLNIPASTGAAAKPAAKPAAGKK